MCAMNRRCTEIRIVLVPKSRNVDPEDAEGMRSIRLTDLETRFGLN
jgi:hypothetical protein